MYLFPVLVLTDQQLMNFACKMPAGLGMMKRTPSSIHPRDAHTHSDDSIVFPVKPQRHHKWFLP